MKQRLWLFWILLIVCLATEVAALDEPLMSKHNVQLDDHFVLADFYVYDYSSSYNEYFARVQNVGPKDFEFVKLYVYLFNNGSLVKTDYSFADFETLGSSGVTSLSETFFNSYVDKVEFDSVSFFIDHSMADVTAPRLVKEALVVSNTLVDESLGLYTVAGLVTNTTQSILKYPQVFVLIYKNGAMVAYEKTYADVSDDQIMPQATAPWETYADLPAQYDSLRFVTGYSITLSGSVYVPVELESFNAVWDHDKVQLKWATASESNNLGFYVERNSGQGWQEIGFVAGAGTVAEERFYHFNDKKVRPNARYEYRLRQVDQTGEFQYSDVVSINSPSIPNRFSLMQNYPNPFNPTTSIAFTIEKRGRYKLAIFDLSGKVVKSVFDKVYDPGDYTVSVSMENYASGSYIYKLENETFNASRRMLLLK